MASHGNPLQMIGDDDKRALDQTRDVSLVIEQFIRVSAQQDYSACLPNLTLAALRYDVS